MAEIEVKFEVDLTVPAENVNLLCRQARALDPEGTADLEQLSVEQALRVLCVFPKDAPVDIGYELLQGTEVRALDEPGEYRLTIVARVFDENKVIDTARQAYFLAWGDIFWMPDCIDEALFELLLASNPNPSPCELGFSIKVWRPALDKLAA